MCVWGERDRDMGTKKQMVGMCKPAELVHLCANLYCCDTVVVTVFHDILIHMMQAYIWRLFLS